jgi:hypothetical protein
VASFEANDLARERIAAPTHEDDVTDANSRQHEAQTQARHPGHSAGGPHRLDARELGLQRIDVDGHDASNLSSDRVRDAFASFCVRSSAA